MSVLLNHPADGPTPTLLFRFDAVATDAGIELRWQFGEPERVVSAGLERADDRVGPWSPLTLEVHREGEANEALDPSVSPGRDYQYRLAAKLTDGGHAVFGPISVTALSAIKVSGLTGIAPNPASSDARIDFAVVREEKVRISVMDVAGREETVLSDGLLTPGRYSLVWDGRSGAARLPAGIYFVQWRSAGTTMQRKLVLMQ